MNFTIDTRVLKDKLDVLDSVIPNKSTLPSFTNLNLAVKEDKIILIGSTSEMSAKTILFAANENNRIKIEETGNVLLNFKMLKEIVSKQSDSLISLKDNGGVKIAIECGRAKYSLNGQDYESYPKIEFTQYPNKLTLSKNVLDDIISSCTISCSQNEKRPVLTGINLCLENGTLKATSTDSFRLSRFELKLEGNNLGSSEFNITIPFASINFIKKLIAKTKIDSIDVLYDKQNLLIAFEDTLFKTRLLDGVYPQTDKIILFSREKCLKINRSILKSTLDRLSILKSETIDKVSKFTLVKLTTKDNKTIELQSEDCQLGNAKEVVDLIESNIGNFEIKFNGGYLMDALSVFKDDEVIIEFAATNRPFIIKSSDERVTQLILPIR